VEITHVGKTKRGGIFEILMNVFLTSVT